MEGIETRDGRRQRRLHRLPAVSRIQRGDPVEAGVVQIIADAGARRHAPVAQQSDPPDFEELTDLVDMVAHSRRIGRVASNA